MDRVAGEQIRGLDRTELNFVKELLNDTSDNTYNFQSMDGTFRWNTSSFSQFCWTQRQPIMWNLRVGKQSKAEKH